MDPHAPEHKRSRSSGAGSEEDASGIRGRRQEPGGAEPTCRPDATTAMGMPTATQPPPSSPTTGGVGPAASDPAVGFDPDLTDHLQSLRDAARAKGTLGFPGGLQCYDANAVVLFLKDSDADLLGSRRVPKRSLMPWQPEWAGRDWQKLVALTGPSGCGKTLMGLFGLTGEKQVLVYLGAPPMLMSEANTDESAAVRRLVEHARAAEHAGEKHRLLRDAVSQQLLAMLLATLGQRPGTADPIDVIFFFDELGAADENSVELRVGLCELAKALRDSSQPGATEEFKFGAALQSRVGLKVRGFALGGVGLDVDALGGAAECQEVTPNVPRQW